MNGAPELTAAGAAATSSRPIHSGFLRSAERFPDRPALWVGGREHTFAELREQAAVLAATIQDHSPDEGPLGAVFAYRSATAFAGILGTSLSGRGYVPLNRTLPTARTRTMLDRSGARTLIVDVESGAQLPDVLDGLPGGYLVIAPDHPDPPALAAALPGHTVLGPEDLFAADAWHPAPAEPEAIAYLLFTSGSTGVPKGVMVAHSNVAHYVDCLVERYGVTEHDRFAQTHDMTFDNSVLDIYVAWERGACVCCPPASALMKPGGFIRDQALTVWFSVPSTAIFARRLGELKPGSYPTLRWSLFAGEPLPVEVAQAWLDAAPHSTVENLYGPTEVTVDCTLHRFDPETTPAEAEHGVVPIGRPLPDMSVLVADADLNEVAPGQQGELLVAGPQVTLGYWRDPEKTAVAFVVPPGRAERHYRTGDLVRRPADADGPLTYLGRIDDQIKVRGVRTELGEIEAAVREESGVDAVVAVGWPRSETGYDGIVAFLGGAGDVDVRALRARLGDRLHANMVPRRVELLDQLPLNPNGKFDRRALTALLEEPART